MKSLAVVLFVSVLVRCGCSVIKKDGVASKVGELIKSVPEVKSETANKTNERNGRSQSTSLKDIAGCLTVLDTSCMLNRAEDLLVENNRLLWDEADKYAVQSGRADEETKPSILMDSISQLMSELTNLFRESLTGFFRDAKEGEDEVEEEEEENDEKTDDKEDDSSRDVEESRGKKKKKKKKAIIKLLLVGAVIATKIKLLLKVFAAHLQIKFLLIALASLLINAARFYLDLKKGHQPQKVIYYEHAQHQHHYDGGDEDWHEGWSRSYENREKTAQDLAYAQQKPDGVAYTRVNDKPNYSWDN